MSGAEIEGLPPASVSLSVPQDHRGSEEGKHHSRVVGSLFEELELGRDLAWCPLFYRKGNCSLWRDRPAQDHKPGRRQGPRRVPACREALAGIWVSLTRVE